jgi:hypothetical protein
MKRVKGKITLSLSSIKHHAKKACGGGEAGIVPRVMTLCSRCKCVVNFTPRPLYPPTTEILIRIEREAGPSQNQSRRLGEEENFVLLPIKPRFLGHPACSLFTTPTEISVFLILIFFYLLIVGIVGYCFI